METTISLIKQMPSTSQEVEAFVSHTFAKVESGEIEALDLKIYLKAIGEAIKQLDELTKPYYMKEAEKYAKGERVYNGNAFEIAELGASYDYSQCNDMEWASIEGKIGALKTEQKAREAFLKTLTDGITTVNEDTGETWKTYPPVKKSTTGLKIKLK